MSDKYILYLYDGIGDLKYIWGDNDILSLQYAYKEKEIGRCNLVLPPIYDIYNDFDVDCILKIYRYNGIGYYLEGERAWLLQDPFYNSSPDQKHIELIFDCSNTYIDRREIAYAAETAQTNRTEFADDMLRNIFKQNAGTSAIAARDLSAFIALQAAHSAAPSISKAFAWRNMLDVMRDICQESFDDGTYLVFDIVCTGGTDFEFRTYTGQRGVDHGLDSGNNKIVLREQTGELNNLRWGKIWSDSKNYAYAGGQGQSTARTIAEQSIPNHINRSRGNRREIFTNASRNPSSAAFLNSEAKALLAENRARLIVDAELQDRPGFVYGLDYKFGDKMVLETEYFSLDVRLDTISVEYIFNQESVSMEENLSLILHGELYI